MSWKDYFIKKQEPEPPRKDKLKLIRESDNDAHKDMPKLILDGSTITIKGKAIPEFPHKLWPPLLEEIDIFMSNKKDVIVEFEIDYFNSGSSRYVTGMFLIFQDHYPECKTTVNWYIDEKDEKHEANFEIIRDSHPKVKVNLIVRQ